MQALIAKLKIQPDKVAAYEQVSRELIATVRAREPGTIYYEQFKTPDEPNSYTVIEVYKDKACQASHAETDYFKAAFAKILTYVDGKIGVQQYETLT
jgi:quinol monooxygenase YgiN